MGHNRMYLIGTIPHCEVVRHHSVLALLSGAKMGGKDVTKMPYRVQDKVTDVH